MKKFVVLALVLGLVLMGKVGAQDKKPGEKSILAYWSFDEGKGNVAKDYSGRGNNGTVAGAAEWVDGIKGKALKFNGKDNQVEVEMNEKLQFTTAVTIEVWIYPTPPHQQNFGGIINNINGFRESRLLLTNWVLVTIQPVGWKQSPTPGEAFSVANSIKNNAWNHLVYVYDGKEESFYVDGKKIGSAPYSEEWPVGDNAMTIGWGTANPDYYHFNGIIDEMKIYNYALSEKEISGRYKEIKK